MRLTKPTADRITILEAIVIFGTAIAPLCFTPSYTINLFLTFEGAFRIAHGEIPYRDFGTPVGYMLWLLPALFFKLFGSSIYMLLVAQCFINVASGFVFRTFLKCFAVPSWIRFLSVLLYCISFSLNNPWPWYNHLVFIFELTGLTLLISHVLKPIEERKISIVLLAALAIAAAFMTKQDTGGLSLGIAVLLLTVDGIYERHAGTALWFAVGYLVSLAILIVPFLRYEFTYWFNFGQFPHNSRVNLFDLLNEFLGASEWLKFYLLLMVLFVIAKFTVSRLTILNKKEVIFYMMIFLILFQASVIQVTSYTPADGNIYFHSFVFPVILINVSTAREVGWPRLAAITCLLLLWWSGMYWNRVIKKHFEGILDSGTDLSGTVSKRNFMIDLDSMNHRQSVWRLSTLPSLKHIKIPVETEAGIHRLLAAPYMKGRDLRLLNMTELTFLRSEVPYEIESGQEYPLWFHKNVAFFNREVRRFCDKVKNKDYDVILFEDIPNLNDFFPYEVRDCMDTNYKLEFRFLAPRLPEVAYVEVYTRQDK